MGTPLGDERVDKLMTTALITGVTGQDGSYLAELLLDKGYVVHGIVRRSSSERRLSQLLETKEIFGHKFFLHQADLDDMTTLRRLLTQLNPEEVYHLAGQSHVGASFEIPESTCEFTAMGTLRLLEMIRDLPNKPKFLHASSSEIFGRPSVSPQNENTPNNPVTPYGVAKTFATNMVRVYREAHSLFACNAICFNHESPRRGEAFVTRKISLAVARIARGLQRELRLGNLDAERDWGYAKEYVEAMWRILQRPTPDDYVIATGERHTIREFMGAAFQVVDLNWQDYVVIDPSLFRPCEVESLVGDPSKAASELGWTARVKYSELARIMVESDLASQNGSSTTLDHHAN